MTAIPSHETGLLLGYKVLIAAETVVIRILISCTGKRLPHCLLKVAAQAWKSSILAVLLARLCKHLVGLPLLEEAPPEQNAICCHGLCLLCSLQCFHAASSSQAVSP